MSVYGLYGLTDVFDETSRQISLLAISKLRKIYDLFAQPDYTPYSPSLVKTRVFDLFSISKKIISDEDVGLCKYYAIGCVLASRDMLSAFGIEHSDMSFSGELVELAAYFQSYAYVRSHHKNNS